ncbi:amidohydrolase family protein [Falsiroseomonas sp. CW058]|uniref:amidohydrolase family protein n=1 Tax=Falsiroseomonas sp. CW058 TaxID=3388664 RepID=UPI003D31BC6C
MTDTPPGRRALLSATALATLAVALPAGRSAIAQQAAAAPARPILVRGARILSMDAATGDLPRGDILVEGGVIRAVAPSIDAADALVVDGAGRIAMPGLVNGHIHLAQTMQRGLSTEHSFVTYFQQIVLRHSNRMTPDDVKLADHAGGLEQIAAGTTTVMDWSRETVSPDHADAAVEGIAAAGIRAILAYTTPPVPQGGDAAALNARMMAHARALMGGRLPSLIGLWTCLQGPDFLPLEPAVADMRRLAELGVPVAIHTGAAHYANRKPRLLAQLDAAGLLNERLQVVHANLHEEDEYRLAGGKGVMMCATPEVEMRMGHGQPAMFRAAAAGMRVSVGTDIPSMVGGGVLPQLRIAQAAELHRINLAAVAETRQVPTTPAVTARRMLEFGTIGGAAGLGLDRVTGSLAPGKRADLILVRTDTALAAPVSDPAGAVLLQAGAGEIDTVIVDGRIRKHEGRLADPDAAAVFTRLQARAEEMAEAARRG